MTAATACLVLGVVAVHLFVKPLDLIWFTLLRKLELYLPATTMLQGLGITPWNA